MQFVEYNNEIERDSARLLKKSFDFSCMNAFPYKETL
jgi:hypothetical protein